MDSTRGITLIEVLCLLAVMAIIGGVLLPMLGHQRPHPRSIKCVNNLKNIGLAYRIWAVDHNDSFPFNVSTNEGGTRELRGDIVFQLRTLSNELSTPNRSNRFD